MESEAGAQGRGAVLASNKGGQRPRAEGQSWAVGRRWEPEGAAAVSGRRELEAARQPRAEVVEGCPDLVVEGWPDLVVTMAKED